MNMSAPDLILCTDLDRTLMPNGNAPFSDKAYELFTTLSEKENVVLVYASGRSKELIKEAINQFNLPLPNHAIADVGATIYRVSDATTWQIQNSWHDLIRKDWKDLNSDSLLTALKLPEGLRTQTQDRQKTFKLSFITSNLSKIDTYCKILSTQLKAFDVKANVIPSINEIEGEGLIDLLPQSANKYHALRFLHQRYKWPLKNIIFCGDSGNDLSTLTSEYQGVLVANATEEVKKQAMKISERHQRPNSLYIAQGRNSILNGNYVAGILEGIEYFRPRFSF